MTIQISAMPEGGSGIAGKQLRPNNAFRPRAETTTRLLEISRGRSLKTYPMNAICQVVIIETKEPPEGLRPNMHYDYFSGVPGIGRPGFFH